MVAAPATATTTAAATAGRSVMEAEMRSGMPGISRRGHGCRQGRVWLQPLDLSSRPSAFRRESRDLCTPVSPYVRRRETRVPARLAWRFAPLGVRDDR